MCWPSSVLHPTPSPRDHLVPNWQSPPALITRVDDGARTLSGLRPSVVGGSRRGSNLETLVALELCWTASGLGPRITCNHPLGTSTGLHPLRTMEMGRPTETRKKHTALTIHAKIIFFHSRHSHFEHGRLPATSRTSLFPPTTDRQRAHQLGIGSFLAAPSHHQCRSVNMRRSKCGRSVTVVRRHQCGVHSQLRPTVQWQTFCHCFKPPRVMHVGCQEIQVSNENIRRNPRPGLAADPLPHSPKQNPACPTPQLCCTLRGGGQKGREDGHTGRCERLGEGGDEVGAEATPGRDGSQFSELGKKEWKTMPDQILGRSESATQPARCR